MSLPLPEPYLLHPAAVHFPIALLTAGWGIAAVAALRRDASWPADAARWLLWLGTLAAWAAMGLGLWAEDTVPHVPEAWQIMNTHRRLAFWTVGAFTALSLGRWALDRRRRVGAAERAFLIAWLAALGALFAAGYYGGELVFTHGVGFQKDG